MKNFPVDVWWPVYEANGAHFAVFGVSGVVHQRVYRGLGHGWDESRPRCVQAESGVCRASSSGREREGYGWSRHGSSRGLKREGWSAS